MKTGFTFMRPKKPVKKSEAKKSAVKKGVSFDDISRRGLSWRTLSKSSSNPLASLPGRPKFGRRFAFDTALRDSDKFLSDLGVLTQPNSLTLVSTRLSTRGDKHVGGFSQKLRELFGSGYGDFGLGTFGQGLESETTFREAVRKLAINYANQDRDASALGMRIHSSVLVAAADRRFGLNAKQLADEVNKEKRGMLRKTVEKKSSIESELAELRETVKNMSAKKNPDENDLAELARQVRNAFGNVHSIAVGVHDSKESGIQFPAAVLVAGEVRGGLIPSETEGKEALASQIAQILAPLQKTKTFYFNHKGGMNFALILGRRRFPVAGPEKTASIEALRRALEKAR